MGTEFLIANPCGTARNRRVVVTKRMGLAVV